MATKKSSQLYDRIREILEAARVGLKRTVNTTQVMANWLIGREIVEEEQSGERRAKYGVSALREISLKLTGEFGSGYSVDNLELFRRFYLEYPKLLSNSNSDAAPRNLGENEKSESVRRKSEKVKAQSGTLKELADDEWPPGRLNPNLSWTHYRQLLRVSNTDARAFYEIEAIKNSWATRELERQTSSLLFERLARSKDKKGLMKLATKGQDVQTSIDIFKDPMIIEFVGLPSSPMLVESELEQALIDNLQKFLLELGKGFAFVSRQERITLDGDHFYIDLVFYHTILKCYILLEIKTGALTHQDLGQLQLYVNYYDEERTTKGDNPTLGLILCTDKNDAVVRYTLGPDKAQKIFASRYKLHLPTEAELQAEIRREVSLLSQKPKNQTSKTKKPKA